MVSRTFSGDILRNTFNANCHTLLDKGGNRLYFITCNVCKSRRFVAATKTSFRSQIGRRKVVS
ncbi:eukaryotic translation initiation factor 2 subunit beta [Penicillium soppii]|uniref:eukaryotic translation initiation factor 2 subunit beta n=1 Tax=Penicillium soppii TaxID=69789 RepID=UPI002546A70A|nr:eukaryotic translation initiation factor 2 subunit beta [Penicillium soppii]KAJ5864736.1 eukaryotic translation initiation factor 2 subunit beta [Penicillium soppii]